jgi:predicted DNA-binding transcriptional regulator AlpA
MAEDKGIVVVEITQLRKIIREELQNILLESNPDQSTPSTQYQDSERLSISQVAEYLGVSTKTITNYWKSGKIPEPEYNFSGKPRWTVLQLRELENSMKAKQKFPIY